MTAIGKYFDNAAANVDTPGYWSGDMGGYLFVPEADETMTLQQLQENYANLLYRIDWWTNRLTWANSTERYNIEYMLSVWQAKKPGYDYLINAKTAAANTGSNSTPTTDTTTTPTTEPAEGKNYLPWILGGVAVVGIYLYKKGKLKFK